MQTPAETTAGSGTAALVLLLRFHGVAADPEQIRHRYGGEIGIPEILRCAKNLGLKARAYHSNWRRLGKTPLPCIAVLRDGRYLILGKISDEKVLVQNPLLPRPIAMQRNEFEALWDGRLVVMAARAGLVELSRHFGITWFLGAIHKYRHLLGEVLVASLFLQLLGLVSPLFFQVVIDKVLVSHTLSTLDVLVVGLFAFRLSKPFLVYCAPIFFPTRLIVSTLSSARAFSATFLLYPCLISKRAAWAI